MGLNRQQIVQLISLFFPLIAGGVAWYLWGTFVVTIIALTVGGVISYFLEQFAKRL
ncbi:MAG: hypothetical protein R3264_11920 [Anaerolineae bacterium]|nr:hypothetical protein [Anaerolineae bacterium]